MIMTTKTHKLVAKLANKVIQADAWQFVNDIPPGVVQTIITSPPYYAKRWYPDVPDRVFIPYGLDIVCKDDHEWEGEYYPPTKMGTVGSTETTKHKKLVNEGKPPPSQFCSRCTSWKGQFGLEPSPSLYIDHAVDFFTHRCGPKLRHDGTLWVNIGDSYAGSGKGAWSDKSAQKEVYVPSLGDPLSAVPKLPPGFKEKDRMMIPAMFAIAMREAGWYLRSEIVWSKPAPMPSGVQDRPSDAHEFIYLFSKQPQYYYDSDAIREPYAESSQARYAYEFNPETQSAQATANPFVGSGKIDPNPQGRNKRTVWNIENRQEQLDFVIDLAKELWGAEFPDVWEIDTRKSTDAHTAGFSVDLILPCILAGSSMRCCPSCYAPSKRVFQDLGADEEWKKASGADSFGEYTGESQKVGGPDPSSAKASILKSLRKKEFTGWVPTCNCAMEATEGSIVFDPFGGTGTTALAAMLNGRRFFMSEFSAEYCEIAEDRLIGYKDQNDVGDMSW